MEEGDEAWSFEEDEVKMREGRVRNVQLKREHENEGVRGDFWCFEG